MLFAAVLLLCFVPFLLVLQSLAGRGYAAGFIRRFGLTGRAAYAVRQAFTSPTATSAAVNDLSWVFLIVGGIAAAAAIQELYERVFEAEGRGFSNMPQRVGWLAAAIGATFVEAWAYPGLSSVGGPVLVAIVSAIGATAFWWFSMWLLLAGRLAWRQLFPSALATGICWLGMALIFRLTISSSITSDYRKYGSIGVVFAIMSLLIAIGVVIMLGALAGVAWRERSTTRSRRTGSLALAAGATHVLVPAAVRHDASTAARRAGPSGRRRRAAARPMRLRYPRRSRPDRRGHCGHRPRAGRRRARSDGSPAWARPR